MLYLMNMINVYLSALQSEEGQDFVEYGLVIALIALVGIASATVLAPQIQTVWTAVETAITAGAAAVP